MAGPLAEMVRAKYPGAYDDLSDDELEASITAKYPGAYDDLVEPVAGAASDDASPSMGDRVSRFFGVDRERKLDPALGRQVQDAMGGSPMGAVVQAGTEGVGNLVAPMLAKPIAGALKRVARVPMRAALGAQSALRRKFPGVDLEGVALREGVSVPDVGKARELSRAANAGIQTAAQQADAAGATPIQPREIIGGLRKIYDRAGAARLPEQQAQVVQEANRLRKLYRGGASVSDALVGKSERQAMGRAALQSAADPRMAATSSKIDAAISRGLGDAAKARSPQVGAALQRSQEMMALEKAMDAASNRTPLLRTALGTAVGTGAGLATGDIGTGLAAIAANHVLTSPKALSLAARSLHQIADPAARETMRAILLSLGAELTNEEP